MNESKKLLIGFGVVLALCCGTAGISYFTFNAFGKQMEKAVNGDPTSFAHAKSEIAEFDMPVGYKPFVVNMFNYDLVTLNPDSSGSGMIIIIMQYTGLISGNSEQMEEQLRQAVSQQNNQAGVPMQIVDTLEVVIRDQTVTAIVSEGQYQNFVMRQWSTVFEGNKGPTILMAQGTTSEWDDQLLEDFIKSIK